jgi:hypothetical protein
MRVIEVIVILGLLIVAVLMVSDINSRNQAMPEITIAELKPGCETSSFLGKFFADERPADPHLSESGCQHMVRFVFEPSDATVTIHPECFDEVPHNTFYTTGTNGSFDTALCPAVMYNVSVLWGDDSRDYYRIYPVSSEYIFKRG